MDSLCGLKYGAIKDITVGKGTKPNEKNQIVMVSFKIVVALIHGEIAISDLGKGWSLRSLLVWVRTRSRGQVIS